MPAKGGGDPASALLLEPVRPALAPVRAPAPDFARGLEQWGERVALLLEEGSSVTYAELARRADAQLLVLGTVPKLVVVEADSSVGAVVAYLACLRAGHPVLPLQPGAWAAGSPILERFVPSGLLASG
jgi:acyl-CoA synthetase (AMP-forming)/AMP-acid ligase II